MFTLRALKVYLFGFMATLQLPRTQPLAFSFELLAIYFNGLLPIQFA